MNTFCFARFGILALMTTSAFAAEKVELTVPEPAAILARLKPGHPRLFATSQEFATLRTQVQNHPRLKTNWAKFRADGEKILTQEPSKYEIPDGKRLLATSRRVLDRTGRLALIYRIEGGQKWVDRAWAELNAAAQFKDWNPSHFLDTAEMTTAFAIGYDWLYDAWTPEQRATIKEAMLKHGLKTALEAYRTGKNGWWVKSQHNWNQVVHGGIGVGALALADEEPALCGELLQNAIKYLPLAMQHFGPDGAWNEGPGYWDYATKYNVFILAALDSALGTDYGLSGIPGFSQTADFPPYFSGPVGKTFNYADAGDKAGGAAQMFWLANKFNNPGWAAWQNNWIEKGPGCTFDYIWGARWFANADGSAKEPPQLAALPLGRYFREAEVVSMRSDWDDKNQIFVGFKAGDNKANHSNLDLGSFVMDALGTRWVVDLGADNYNLPEYFGKKRWTYYRMRPESHNTLVLNPSQEPGQDPKAFARITKFDLKDCCTSAVADLTPAYQTDAQSIKRGIGLLDGNQVLVQDEVTAKAPSKLFWFLHTPAKIEVAENGQSATLSIGDKKLLARLLGPTNAKFSVLDAKPLPTSPNPEGQKENKGIQRLTIELNDVTTTRLRVLLTPLSGTDIPAAPDEKALAEW
ncbi:MAG TPA: heparinase II/III family protein [Abditibacteriaceae bacterium]